MWDGNVSIQDTERRGVECPRGQETRNKVNIPWSVAIRGDIDSQVGDDLVYYNVLIKYTFLGWEEEGF